MPPALLILLLGAVRWTASYTIHPKESLPRVYRGPYEDWRPVSDAATSYQRTRHTSTSNGRYPVHYKGFALGPPKKPLQQSAEHSQNVQVFSPAPPTILGSFSVFGHATVNAREPASLISKKPVKQTSGVDYPTLETAQSKYYPHSSSGFGYSNSEPVKRPQRYNGYDQTYLYEDERRHPNRDASNKAAHAQSTSLNPNTYYYDQSQPFHASNIDSSYHKARKPQKSHLNQGPYRGSDSGFAVTTEDYRTSVDPYNTGSFYNSPYKNQKNPPQVTPYYDRLPFGDISIGGSHQAHKGHAKDIYNQYSHLSRPFQNTQTFNPLDNVPTYPPFVTTFSAPNTDPARVKFSEVAQPFQIENKYHHQSTYTPRPSYIVTQQPYTEELYPYAVTTIGVPSNTVRQQNLEYTQSSLIPSPRPHTTTSNSQYGGFSSHRPSQGVNNYQSNKDYSHSFLPTPSSDDHSLVIEPTPDDQPTQQPQVLSTIENKDQELSTIDSTTWIPSETTTTTTAKPMTTLKSRRRPSRPVQGSRNQDNPRLKNHKVNEEVSTTTDSQKNQRRRKPSNKHRENSEYKRTRTSTATSTTEAPTQTPTENDEEQFVETTDPIIYGETYKDSNDAFLLNTKPDAYDVYQQPYFHPEKYPTQELPENELYSPTNENNFQYASSSTAEPVTSPIPPTTPRRTSPTSPSTVQPVSVTSPPVETTSNTITSRVKNKYGNNRPRFSVKDYRERLNKATSTSSPQANIDVEPPKTKNEFSRVRHRGSQKATSESSVSDDSTTESTSRPRKFKPRYNPSRNFYKTSTTQRPDVLESSTTTERPNTFRPSTNRYKPGTGKYYSRYKTSSLSPKEVDDSPVTTTARIVIKPKGVFSAKKRPSVMKKVQESDSENENVSEEMTDLNTNFGDTLKTTENEVTKSVFNKKMDDLATTLVTSEEVKDQPLQTNTPEAQASSSTTEATTVAASPIEEKVASIADLTSSSSNDYHSASIFRHIHTNRRPIKKFVIPSEEPILPLEAFFQTRPN